MHYEYYILPLCVFRQNLVLNLLGRSVKQILTKHTCSQQVVGLTLGPNQRMKSGYLTLLLLLKARAGDIFMLKYADLTA